jgi:hypothetical protein
MSVSVAPYSVQETMEQANNSSKAHVNSRFQDPQQRTVCLPTPSCRISISTVYICPSLTSRPLFLRNDIIDESTVPFYC